MFSLLSTLKNRFCWTHGLPTEDISQLPLQRNVATGLSSGQWDKRMCYFQVLPLKRLHVLLPNLFPWETVKTEASTFNHQVEATCWRQKAWALIYSKLVHEKEISFHPISANVSVELPNTGICSVSHLIQEAWVRPVLHSLSKAPCCQLNTLKGMFKTI